MVKQMLVPVLLGVACAAVAAAEMPPLPGSPEAERRYERSLAETFRAQQQWPDMRHDQRARELEWQLDRLERQQREREFTAPLDGDD